MQSEMPLTYPLQQHEITKTQPTNFTQIPFEAESLEMTMSPYLMDGSPITSNKPLKLFIGTYPNYSVEAYLIAFTANQFLNIGPEPINTPLHQKWIHRCTALIQTTIDGSVQKRFSVLPEEFKPIGKNLNKILKKNRLGKKQTTSKCFMQ